MGWSFSEQKLVCAAVIKFYENCENSREPANISGDDTVNCELALFDKGV